MALYCIYFYLDLFVKNKTGGTLIFMESFKVNILGCGSATPSLRHLQSCQVVDFRDSLMMIDCGEGSQLELRRRKLKFTRLTHIFISHIHGDHCLGLPGLLSTLSLHGREGGVKVYMLKDGIKLLKPVVEYLCQRCSYDLEFIEIPPKGGVLLDTNALTVEAFPLYHRVPCVGFIFREKEKLRHINGEMVKFYDVPVRLIPDIKAGADLVLPDGRIIDNSILTTPATPSSSYAYCSDTMFDTRVAEAVKGVDTIYHEATYLSDLAQSAHERGHSTAAEAAQIAKLAGAKRLIIGHYSKRYIDFTPLLDEARAIFPNTIAADEGLVVDLHTAL